MSHSHFLKSFFQGSLKQLFLCDGEAKFIEAGSRINSKLQQLSNVTACPPVQYFKASQQILLEVLGDNANSNISVEDAVAIMENLKQEADKRDSGMRNDLTLANFQIVEVPEIEGQNYQNVVINWLTDLEACRSNLLKTAISWYLHAGKDSNVNISIPHQEIIQHQFVEEMASLRKCLEVSDKDKIHFIRLMKLLARRMNWLLTTYKQITEGM